MPRNKHPHRKRPHSGSNGHRPPRLGENRGRSILASVGIRPDRIGRPGFCSVCGRGVEDGAKFGDGMLAPVYAHVCQVPDASGEPQQCEACAHDEQQRAELMRTDLVCTFCRFHQCATQFVASIYRGIKDTRRKVFSPGWVLVAGRDDGAAWVHELRGLRVLESLALAHDAEPTERPTALIAGLPILDTTEFGQVAIVKTFDGSQEIHREKYAGTLDTTTICHAVWKWNAEGGWRWWHHVSVARADGAMPTYDDLATVRREFVTTMRECYQIFPPEDRFVNIHERVLHLWHCVDGNALDAQTGRLLPQFEEELSGQKERP